MPLLVGLIGISGYGRVHLEQILRLQELGRVRLACVTVPAANWDDPMRSELAGMGIPLYQDYNDMLAACGRELDLCCIPTPIHWHGIMTVDCLHAGANVLVEKPLAGSLEECRMIHSAQKETGRLVAVGFHNVYDPSTLLLKERILDGVLGPIRKMSGFGLSPRSVDYYRRNDWAGKLQRCNRPVLDSPANNAMAHYLQLLLFMGGGSIESSLAPTDLEAELYRANPIEGPDTVNLRIGTDANIDVRFVVSHADAERIEMELRVEGTCGSLTWRQNGMAELLHQDKVETYPIPTHQAMQMNVVERVVARLESGDGLICTPELAEMHTRCIVAAHASAEVRPVSPEHVSIQQFKGANLFAIKGIAEVLCSAAKEDSSFHDTGVSWAKVPPCRSPVMLPQGVDPVMWSV